MKCEDIQIDLPLYIDDVLDDESRASIEGHLPSCPLCRQRVSEYVAIRNGLRTLSAPSMPSNLEVSIRDSIASRARASSFIFYPVRKPDAKETLLHWLMPYCAGTVGALLFLALFLNFLLMKPYEGSIAESDRRFGDDMIASNIDTGYVADGDSPIRIEIPEKSPEVNPAGALIALTKSIVRGKMTDEEVVVVADVFGDGLANISEVVDPPENANAMRELEKAFNTRPEEAPFLPAKMGRNSDAVRVVLKIQRVDVSDN